MKNSIARKVLIAIALSLILFFVAVFFVISNINATIASDNAVNLLGVFETQMHDGMYTELGQYKILVKYSTNAKNIRVSVIDLNGKVLADTLNDDTESIENHADRPEFIEALKGNLGKDIRRSATFNVNYLYVARLINIEQTSVVLRLSVPIASINTYLTEMLVTMIGILFAVLIIVYFTSKKIAETAIVPVKLIKLKLDSVMSDGANSPMTLTKYDEINIILQEIDNISESLSSSLNNYQKEKEKLDFILGNINLGVLALDCSKNIIASNKIAKDYFNYNFDSIININKITRDNIILENINSSIVNNEHINFDRSYKNGKIFEIKLFPISSNEIKLIIIINDVTDVRKLAVEKQEFFINAGHELNTPLSSILGYSEMQLKSEQLNKQFIETINKEAIRMKLLISDMMNISELEEHKQIIDEQIDIKKIVGQVIISQIPKAEKKKITLISDLDDCSVFVNNEKITEVVSNLIDNAIKYTNEGGKVEIFLKAYKDKIQFKVKDNGVGIAAKDLSRIFERFYRTDKGRSKAEGGTGLGLAIVKHICNYYNAPISVASKESIGTEFTITFNRHLS